MKKMAVIIFIVLLICITSCDKREILLESSEVTISHIQSSSTNIYTSEAVYKIEYSFTLLENNNVGNEWEKVVYVNGEKFESGEIIAAKDGESVEIKIFISEKDKIPDQNTKTVLLNTKDGESLCETIAVCENRGQYSGNTATWQFNCRVIKKQKA